MSLYSAGRITGVAIESGEGMTHSNAIYEGYIVSNKVVAAESSEIAGSALDAYLQ